MRILLLKTLLLLKKTYRSFIYIKNRSLAFKNNAPFTNCISKINNVLIENAEDVDVVMPVYNLIEYIKSYRKTTNSLWNFYRDEPNKLLAADYNANPMTNSESFKYKTRITGKHQMQIKKTVKTLSKEMQRLRKILKLLFH